MTREEKIANARALRKQGLTLGVIGARLGVHATTVGAWLNPERKREASRRSNAKLGAYKLAWAYQHDRKPCSRCGRLRTPGNHRRAPNGFCRVCRLEARSRARAERRERIMLMWADDLKMAEIAAALGSTAKSVSVEIALMRSEGYDLPHRNRAPERVAA